MEKQVPKQFLRACPHCRRLRWWVKRKGNEQECSNCGGWVSVERVFWFFWYVSKF